MSILDYNEYDIWNNDGNPLYKDVEEPLFALDWDEVRKNCNTESVDLGLFYGFQFDSANAVENYSGREVHFYNNHAWL